MGCGGARPYRAMAKAASSEENVAAQAEDHRLKMRLRETILASDPQKVLDLTPYAYMGHAFLVGFVAQRSDADDLVARVRSLEGRPWAWSARRTPLPRRGRSRRRWAV